MCIVVVDWDEYDVFREYIDLMHRPQQTGGSNCDMALTFLVHFPSRPFW